MKAKNLKAGMRVAGLGVSEVHTGPVSIERNGKTYTAKKGQLVVVYNPTQEAIDETRGLQERTTRHLAETSVSIKQQIGDLVLELYGQGPEILHAGIADAVQTLRLHLSQPELKPWQSVSILDANDDLEV